MPHVFISYSSKDAKIARQLYLFLTTAGAETFLAEISIKPGVHWKQNILDNLKNSKWVFFLATPDSCKSQPVAHEIGASLALNKIIIPIMYNVKPSDLPPWVNDAQAIDIHDSEKIAGLISQIGETIKSDKFWTGVIVGALVCLGIYYLSS